MFAKKGPFYQPIHLRKWVFPLNISSFNILLFVLFFLFISPREIQALPSPSPSKAKKHRHWKAAHSTRRYLRLARKYKRRHRRRRRYKRRRKRRRSKTRTIVGNYPGCRVKWNLRTEIRSKKMDLEAWIRLIAKQTCQNFILTDNLKRYRFHVISESRVTLRNAYKALFSTLEANNLTALKQGGYWKIIRTHKGRQSPIPTYTGRFRHPRRDELVTYLYRVKYLQASTLNYIIRQLSHPSGGIIIHNASNTILITDYASNLYRVLRILKQLDVPQAATKEYIHIIPVYNAKAQDIAQKLRQLFQVGRRRRGIRRRYVRFSRRRSKVLRRRKSKKGDDDAEDSYRISKMIADERTNQIIILANNRAAARAKKLTKDLDLALPDDGQIRVHYLKYANAEELAQTLSQMTQGTKKRRRYRRRYRRRSPKKAAELFEGEVKVTADKATNSLVIVSSKRDYESLLRVIRQLDISRKQIYIEIVILEMSIDKSRELGLTFHYGANPTGEKHPSLTLLGTNLGGQNSLVLSPTALVGLAFGLQGSEIPGVSGLLGNTSTKISSFGLVIRALQSNTDVDIISTPHILTTANKEAFLQVGQNVPFIAGTSYTGMGIAGMPNIRNVQRQDVALTIKIKPQINAGDYVRLDFQQELTELAGNDPELGPTTTKRKIKTVILARDRQTVVIGGLVRDKVTHGVSKVPILGDIPILGNLFKVKKKSVEKRNMLVFLTPYIIHHISDFHRIYEEKMKERKKFAELFYAYKNRRVPNNIDYSRTHGVVEQIERQLETAKKETSKMASKKLNPAQEAREQRQGKKSEKSKKPPLPKELPMPHPRSP